MTEHGTHFDLTNVMDRCYPKLAVAEFTRNNARVVQRFAAKTASFALSSDAHAVAEKRGEKGAVIGGIVGGAIRSEAANRG